MKKRSIKHIYLLFLYYAFFLYGILYFFNPKAVYDDSSGIKYIRFIIVVLLWIVLFKKEKARRIGLYFLLTVLLITDACIAGIGGAFDLINVINFTLPISCLYLYRKFDKQELTRIIEIIYIVSSCFTYLECFVFKGIYAQFSYNGYRAASIFNSPNTYGCFLVLMSCIVLYDKEIKMTYKIVAVFNSALMAYLTGSRACLLILFISYVIILTQWLLGTNRIKKHSIIYVLLGILFVIIGVYLFGNKISSISTRSVWKYDLSRLFSLSKDTRTLYNLQFMEAVNRNFIFPWFDEMVYVDNIYFFIWGRFGFHILFLYIILLVKAAFEIVRKRQNENLCLLICFMVYGTVLNYMYLWPNCFIFWYFIGDVFNKVKRSEKTYG